MRKPLNIKQILARMNLSGVQRRPMLGEESREKLDLDNRGTNTTAEQCFSKSMESKSNTRSEGQEGLIGVRGQKK